MRFLRIAVFAALILGSESLIASDEAWAQPVGADSLAPLGADSLIVVGTTATLPDDKPTGSDSLPPPDTTWTQEVDTTWAQEDSVHVRVDTARAPQVLGSNGSTVPRADACPLGPKRRPAQGVVAIAFLGTNLELFRRFKNAWWSGEKSGGFFFNADWDQEFRDQDKFGHLYGGYHLTRAGHTLLRGACVSQKRAIFFSALYATLFQLQIEIWDAQYAKYGFSYPDLLANTAGTGLAVLHALNPATEIVKPTISYRRTEAVKQRQPHDEIRHSIDYTGQTYWFSLDVDAALAPPAQRFWPGILRVSVGHSITDWILPRPAGAPHETPQQVVRAKRRILLSLDIDAGKLPGNHPAWNFVKRQLSFIRLPAPALQIAPEVDLLRWYR